MTERPAPSGGRHRGVGWRAYNRQNKPMKPPLRTRAAHNTLLFGLFVGGVLFVTGLAVTPGDRDLGHLAHRLDAAGVAATAHDAEVWHACTHKGCTGSDHVRALVELPGGESKVLLHGSDANTQDLPENRWSPATEATRYAGTVDVLYDPTAPTDTVMAVTDVRSWVSGDSADTVREDAIASLIGLAIAVASGFGLAWRAGIRPRDLRPSPKWRRVRL